MLLFPIILLSFAYLLPLSVELKQVVMVQAAMPCAVFPIVLARHFNGSPEVALKVVLSTTLLSLVTIPLWLTYGMSLFNF
jgi:predicted permease